MGKLYSIRNWSDTFENNRSRAVDKLQWVCLPNRHDGESYSYIMAHENGAQIYTAWILMLQVASKGSKAENRGTLIRGNGKPHTATTLSVVTRAPEQWFEMAIAFLLEETDWLEVQEFTEGELGERQANVSQVPSETSGERQVGDESVPTRAQNGMERKKGIEGKEERGAFAPPTHEDLAAFVFELDKDPDFECKAHMSQALMFRDHFQSNGWKVGGRTKMKDWKAAFRKWVRSDYQKTGAAVKSTGLSATERISLNKRVEEIDVELKDINRRMGYDTSDHKALREERKQLQATKKQIKATLEKADAQILEAA